MDDDWLGLDMSLPLPVYGGKTAGAWPTRLASTCGSALEDLAIGLVRPPLNVDIEQ